MRLYRTVRSVQREAPAAPRAVSIGVFDGLHLGHRSILDRLQAESTRRPCASLVFSFEPTPKEFFAPTNPPARLTSFRERFERLRGIGIDELFCPRFAAVR